MFGCIGRLVVLGVLVVAGAVGYVTRDRWMPAVQARISAPRNRSSAGVWEPIRSEGANRVRAALDSLKRPGAAAFVHVAPGDAAAFALGPVVSKLATSPGARPPAARAVYDVFSLRGAVQMKELGGAAALGPLAGVLEGAQDIEVHGRIEVDSASQRALYRVTRVIVGQVTLPDAVLGRLVEQLVSSPDKAVPAGAIAFALDPIVADVRLTPRRVTLYRGTR